MLSGAALAKLDSVSAAELVAFTSDLIRVPTVNPPGDAYEECAHLVGDRLAGFDFDVEYFAALGRPEHTPTHPRINVIGLRRGRTLRPCLHLNGHLDVVPAGAGSPEGRHRPRGLDRNQRHR